MNDRSTLIKYRNNCGSGYIKTLESPMTNDDLNDPSFGRCHEKCAVRTCANTLKDEPLKIFFPFPSQHNLRTAWLTACGLDVNNPPKYELYCCEEHFDLKRETNVALLQKVAASGGIVPNLLKDRAVPHRQIAANPSCPATPGMSGKKSWHHPANVPGGRSSEDRPTVIQKNGTAGRPQLSALEDSQPLVYVASVPKIRVKTTTELNNPSLPPTKRARPADSIKAKPPDLNSSNSQYKECVVPNCPTNLRTFPDAKFVCAPFLPTVREVWYKTIGRPMSGERESETTYFCTDHFRPSDLETFKLPGSGDQPTHVRAKYRVVPSLKLGRDESEETGKSKPAAVRIVPSADTVEPATTSPPVVEVAPKKRPVSLVSPTCKRYEPKSMPQYPECRPKCPPEFECSTVSLVEYTGFYSTFFSLPTRVEQNEFILSHTELDDSFPDTPRFKFYVDVQSPPHPRPLARVCAYAFSTALLVELDVIMGLILQNIDRVRNTPITTTLRLEPVKTEDGTDDDLMVYNPVPEAIDVSSDSQEGREVPIKEEPCCIEEEIKEEIFAPSSPEPDPLLPIPSPVTPVPSSTSSVNTDTFESMHLCPRCLGQFNSREKFDKHVIDQSCKKYTGTYFNCETCGRTYYKPEDLRVHTSIMHKYVCPKCSDTFRFRRYLEDHVGECTGTNELSDRMKIFIKNVGAKTGGPSQKKSKTADKLILKALHSKCSVYLERLDFPPHEPNRMSFDLRTLRAWWSLPIRHRKAVTTASGSRQSTKRSSVLPSPPRPSISKRVPGSSRPGPLSSKREAVEPIPKLKIKLPAREEVSSPPEAASVAVSPSPRSPDSESDDAVDVETVPKEPKPKKRARPLEDSSSDDEVITPSRSRTRRKPGDDKDSPRSPERRLNKNLRERKKVNMAESHDCSSTGSASKSKDVSSALSQWWSKCRTQARAQSAESQETPQPSHQTAEPASDEPDLSDTEGISELDDVEDDFDPDPPFDPAAERSVRRRRKSRNSLETSDSEKGEEDEPAQKQSKKGPYICGICSAPFAGVEGLRMHHRSSSWCSKHEPGMVFKCQPCKKLFPTQTHLDEHRTHSPACRIPQSETEASKKNASSGTSVLTNGDDFQILSCSSCDKMFSSMYLLLSHTKKSEKCSNFKKIGTQKKDVKLQKPGSYAACKNCKVRFNTKHGLGLHLKRSPKCVAGNPTLEIPGSGTKSIGESCETSKGILMRGLECNRKSDPKKENVYMCSKCYASFSSVWGLRTHERSSANCKPDRPYEIPVPIPKAKADELKKEYLTRKSEGLSTDDENKNTPTGFLMVYRPETSDGRPIHGNYHCGACKASFTSVWGIRTHQRMSVNCKDSIPIEHLPPPKTGLSKAAAESIKKGENVCPNCSARFSTSWGLRTHLRNSAICAEDDIKDPVCSCERCRKPFASSEKLRKHFRENPSCLPADVRVTEKGRIKPGPGNFLCPQCPKVFKLPTSLEQHFVEHAGGEVWNCCKCQKECADSIELHQHFRNEHAGVWFCIMCIEKDPKVMDSFKEFYSHIFENHAKDEENTKQYFKCTFCYRSFLSKYCLDLHMMHCRKHADQIFSCASCSKVFNKKIHITNHMKYAHADHAIDPRYTFKCPDCPRKFLSHRDWKEKHKMEGCNQAELKCDECGEFFVGSEKLAMHVKLCHSSRRKNVSSTSAKPSEPKPVDAESPMSPDPKAQSESETPPIKEERD